MMDRKNMRVVLQVAPRLRKGVGLHYRPFGLQPNEFPKKFEALSPKKVVFGVQLRKSG